MTARTLERRLARLLAKQRSFDSWTDGELVQAIQLFSRSPDGLTSDEERQQQRYSARMPPICDEVAAMSEEQVALKIQELKVSLGYEPKPLHAHCEHAKLLAWQEKHE